MLRNKILYFMILIELCLLCVLYDAYQPLALLWIALCLPIVLLLRLIFSAFAIKITVEEETAVVTRQNIHETGVTIENKSIFPMGQMILSGNVDGERFGIYVYLKGKSRVKVLYPVDCTKCGIKNVTIESVTIFDYLRIFKWIKRIRKKVRIIVVPKVYDINPTDIEEGWDFDGESEYFSEDKPGDDPSEIFDIRDYELGDRLSRIHWKLSVKRNKLMIKEYSKPLYDGVVFFLDSQKGEECMDVLFSIGLFMIESKRKVWINNIQTKAVEEYAIEFVNCLMGKHPQILRDGTDLKVPRGRKVICAFDLVDNKRMEALLCMAEEDKVYLVVEEEKNKGTLEGNGICVCDMSTMDVPTAIERIINE